MRGPAVHGLVRWLSAAALLSGLSAFWGGSAFAVEKCSNAFGFGESDAEAATSFDVGSFEAMVSSLPKDRGLYLSSDLVKIRRSLEPIFRSTSPQMRSSIFKSLGLDPSDFPVMSMEEPAGFLLRTLETLNRTGEIPDFLNRFIEHAKDGQLPRMLEPQRLAPEESLKMSQEWLVSMDRLRSELPAPGAALQGPLSKRVKRLLAPYMGLSIAERTSLLERAYPGKAYLRYPIAVETPSHYISYVLEKLTQEGLDVTRLFDEIAVLHAANVKAGGAVGYRIPVSTPSSAEIRLRSREWLERKDAFLAPMGGRVSRRLTGPELREAVNLAVEDLGLDRLRVFQTVPKEVRDVLPRDSESVSPLQYAFSAVQQLEARGELGVLLDVLARRHEILSARP